MIMIHVQGNAVGWEVLNVMIAGDAYSGKYGIWNAYCNPI